MKWVEKSKEKLAGIRKGDGNQAQKPKPAAGGQGARSFKLSFNRSVGTKLFLLIFCSILLCVVTVGTFSYQISKNIIEDKVADSSMQTVTQTASKLDLMFQNLNELTMQLIFDNEIQNSLNTLNNAKQDAYEQFEAVKRIDTKFQSMLMSNTTIAAGYLIPIKEGLNPITSGASSTDYDAIRSSEWFQEVVARGGQPLWLPAEPNGNSGSLREPALSISRLVKSTSSNQEMYVLLLEVKYSELMSQLSGLNLGQGSAIKIVDDQGRLIFTEDLSELTSINEVMFTNDERQDGPFSKRSQDSNSGQVLAVFKKFNSIDWWLLGEIPVNELVKDAGQIRNITVIASLLAVVLALGIGYLVIRMIAMPLRQLRDLMTLGERGDLTVRSTIRKSDEIGQLAQSFNQMMAQIGSLASQTYQSASDVLQTAEALSESSKKTAVSAKEIAVATEEIAGGATSLAMEAERGSDLTDNIGRQMKHVISANNEMVVSAGNVQQSSEQGTRYMDLLIEKTGLTEEMTRSMVEKVDKLKESTGSIRKILEVLNNLTKQTNILSLNATIEAARAGAAGRGFMVVADEIRQLADQSRQSIDVVGQITETIQREIDETVSVLSEAYPIFQEQIVSVKEANQLFYSVQNQMSTFVDRLDSVTSSIGELDQSQTTLMEAMGSVSAVAEQSSATSEEVASLSNEQLSISEGLVKLSDTLEGVSNALKETLSRFKI
ncbi:methyl-accepting chemotaxis protein [Paenibacillus sp. 598K]|uniref:methyl-accepting chemotaxis protein n=1 Tax=Paenibacillus sp. 598K TaxID=1117987 RepID=UPI000FFEC146|nr:methyl-accepting chemotaxis protein [Paenibacillus sp. 598K]